MSVDLSIALLFSSKTIPSASSLKYVLYRWVTIQKGCCFPSRNAKGIKYPIALSIIVVDDVEGPEPSTVNKGIGHEIYGPFLISHQGYYNGISGIVLHSFPWLLRKREPLPHIHASYLTRTQIWIHFLDLSNDLITSPSG